MKYHFLRIGHQSETARYSFEFQENDFLSNSLTFTKGNINVFLYFMQTSIVSSVEKKGEE